MSKLAGIISIIAGFLFCVPAGSVVWQTLHYHQHDFGGVWLSVLGLHLSGQQTWLFLAGCIFVGLALLVIGIFAMLSSSSSDSSS